MEILSSFRNHARPEDVAAIAYLIVLSVIISIYHSGLELWGLYILAHLMIIFAIVALVRSSVSPIVGLSFFRDWYHVIIFLFAFEEMNTLIHIIKSYWVSQMLIEWDYRIFGVHPTVWFEQYMTPWVTEYMEFSYFAYYLLIPIPGGVLYYRNKKKDFSNFMFAVSLAYYCSYLSFLFFPAEGPWVTIPHLQTVEYEGFFFTTFNTYLHDFGAIKGGCFPSSHVAAAFAVLLSMYKTERWMFYILLPIVFSLAVSTVYGRYHYAVDAIAGIALGVFTYLLSRFILSFQSKK